MKTAGQNCVIGTQILHRPYVWGLGLAGVVVAGWKLSLIRKREQERK